MIGMSLSDQALLISSVTLGIVNLTTALWTLLRACQTYHMVKKQEDQNSLLKEEDYGI